MHDVPPHLPDTRHPLAQQIDEPKGLIKRPGRSNRMKKGVARGSEIEPREAGRGLRV